jgi:hypothetical protein
LRPTGTPRASDIRRGNNTLLGQLGTTS